MLIITHHHLDHCGALPYFVAHTNFKGKIVMTNPTKAIFKYVLNDYVKVSNMNRGDELYNEKDLNYTLSRIDPVGHHKENVHNGIKYTSFNAGHVLGAAMFLVEIDGVRILYTGDYS